MSKKFFIFSIFILLTVIFFVGFMISDGNDPIKGKQNTDSKLVNYNFTPQVEYHSPNATLIYVDSLNGDNTIAGLQAKGYKTYYRSNGSPGTSPIWFQGNPTTISFPAYNGPPTGFVQADYNCVTGANNIDNWLVLPKLNVNTGDSLFFYSGAYNSATYPDSIRVMYSAAGDSIPEAGSWVELGRFRLTSYYPSLVVPWAQNGFRAPTGGVNGRFAIRYCVFNGGPSGLNSSTIGIDYIRVISSTAYPLNAFNLQSPTAGVTLSTLAGSATPISITWDTSASGATYKWKYVSTSGPTRSLTIPAGTNSISTSSGALDALLAGIGLNPGDSTIGQWDVWAFKDPSQTGPDSLKSTNGPRAITLRRGAVVIIGSGNIWVPYPFYTYSMESRTDMLYLGSEIGIVSTITAIAFDVGGYPTQGLMNGFNIKMQNSTLTTLTGFADTTAWTTVYSGTYTVTGTGWRNIALTTPFALQTGKNLIIEICFSNSTYTLSSSIRGTATSQLQLWHRHQNIPTGNGCTDPLGLTVTETERPNIRLTMSGLVGVEPIGSRIPAKYSLEQNYPNPFNPTTKINFAIPKQGFVALKIYNVLGREVKTLVNEVKTPGNYIVDFNAEELSSGVYFYKIIVSDASAPLNTSFVETKKMLLIK